MEITSPAFARRQTRPSVGSDAGLPRLVSPLHAEIPSLAPGELERLSCEYARRHDGASDLRDVLVLHHQKLVRSIASRFVGAGEALEDLIQVGNIGLLNALDRFDPDQGNRFSTFATPTILGEIKRHFRDKTPGIKVPRWLQELHQSARKTTVTLTHTLGRAPSVSEIAAHLQVSEEQIVEAMESREAMSLLSLDTPGGGAGPGGGSGAGGDNPAALADLIGSWDRTLTDFETFGDLRAALGALNTREREVIALRFFDDLSQAKIAAQLDISQMHVSRLQQRALKHLREMLSDEPRAGKRLGAHAGRVLP